MTIEWLTKQLDDERKKVDDLQKRLACKTRELAHVKADLNRRNAEIQGVMQPTIASITFQDIDVL
ncbi:hypothetical protein PI125_g11548 [Phytophthora idaei]|nr:hypothetical protein PI125_g11548 [Phytophthora idaei]KAG3154224.1 hypothetical protein PI126_g9708 [Phytophthora idaei]